MEYSTYYIYLYSDLGLSRFLNRLNIIVCNDCFVVKNIVCIKGVFSGKSICTDFNDNYECGNHLIKNEGKQNVTYGYFWLPKPRNGL